MVSSEKGSRCAVNKYLITNLNIFNIYLNIAAVLNSRRNDSRRIMKFTINFTERLSRLSASRDITFRVINVPH